MNPEAEYRNLLESRGISLQSPGLTEIALNRVDALLAIDLVRSASISILGGDVYFNEVTGIVSAYANWHCDPVEGEDRNDFVFRSCRETKDYIESFPSTEETPVFVLVIDS